MKSKLIIVLALVFSQKFFAQSLPAYTLKGEEINLLDEINNTENEYVMLFSWSAWYCGPCIRELNEFNKYYTEFSKKNHFKLIALNIDDEKNLSARWDNLYKQEYGEFSSITNFLKKFKEKKQWNFDVLSDPNRVYFQATGKYDTTPFIIFFYRGNTLLLHNGFIDGTFDNYGQTYQFFNQIFTDFNNNIVYLDKNKTITSKNINPEFKAQFIKSGNIYTTTIKWLTGEKFMEGLFEDKWFIKPVGKQTVYYKNGKTQTISNYENGKLHGSYKEFYENGKISIEGHYWEGDKDSVWVYYDEQGNETKSELWERGLQVNTDKN